MHTKLKHLISSLVSLLHRSTTPTTSGSRMLYIPRRLIKTPSCTGRVLRINVSS